MWVIVRTQAEGIHRWPSAPEELGFLRNRHRHVFAIEVWIEVSHADREVEFILVQRRIQQALRQLPGWSEEGGWGDFGDWSCEQIGMILLEKLCQWYGEQRCYRVGVFEDGENGAVVEHPGDREERG